MANQLLTFLVKEDELALLRFIEKDAYDVYPRRVPADWKPFKATLANWNRLPDEDVYLHATDLGPAEVDSIKRGKDKGFWRINEVTSPVIFFERSKLNEDGELVSGQLWAELDVTQQTGRRNAAPERFRARYLELERHVRATYRKSHPKGFLVGPHCARTVKETALKLREAGHWGRAVEVHS
jgi:hypothetical protein